MSNLGNNIKKYREIKGYTQKELAELLGKTKNVVSNWENGVNKPDPDTIELLLGLLDVDANTLLGWDKPEQIKIDAEKLAGEMLMNENIKSVLPKIIGLSEEDIKLVLDFIKRLSK